jgi:cytochrome d ubiquinol oxidase subunit I
MQHPVGYKIVDGEAQLTSVWALLSNDFALRAYLHTMLAGLIFGSIVVLGVCCWHFLRGDEVDLFRKGGEGSAHRRGAGDGAPAVVGNRFGEAGHERAEYEDRRRPRRSGTPASRAASHSSRSAASRR